MPLNSRDPGRVDKLEAHDRYQLEVKLEYPCSPDDADLHFVTEAYFFVPESLEVHSRSYSAREFYADLRDRLRLKTPRISLADLLTADASRSPLAALDALAAAAPPAAPPAVDDEALAGDADDQAIYQAKLLGCVVRARLRDLWAAVSRERTSDDAGDRAQAAARLDQAAEDLAEVLRRYRAAAEALSRGAPDSEPAQVRRLLDSYLSLTAEAFALRALDNGGAAWPTPTADRLKALAAREDAHRRARGYRAVLQPGSTNAEFVYRHGMLKKFAATVLYLNSHLHDERVRFETWAFALAAGIAMAFATAVMFWATSLAPLSWSLFAVLVVSYMAKDRLKELLKGMLTRWGDAWLSDHSVDLIDPLNGRRLGIFRQKFHFVEPDRVPAPVREVRALARTEFLAEREFSERVFVYRKVMRLRSRDIVGGRGRADALVDVLRFNLRRFLHAMDEPTAEVLHLDAETGELQRVQATRVYHVNVILRFGQGKRPTSYHHRKVRVTLTREGIEQVDTIAQRELPAVRWPR